MKLKGTAISLTDFQLRVIVSQNRQAFGLTQYFATASASASPFRESLGVIRSHPVEQQLYARNPPRTASTHEFAHSDCSAQHDPALTRFKRPSTISTAVVGRLERKIVAAMPANPFRQKPDCGCFLHRQLTRTHVPKKISCSAAGFSSADMLKIVAKNLGATDHIGVPLGRIVLVGASGHRKAPVGAGSVFLSATLSLTA